MPRWCCHRHDMHRFYPVVLAAVIEALAGFWYMMLSAIDINRPCTCAGKVPAGVGRRAVQHWWASCTRLSAGPGCAKSLR